MTPTMVFSDGRVMAGARKSAEILKFLDNPDLQAATAK